MKNFKTGILFLSLIMVITCVGYSSNVSQTKNTDYSVQKENVLYAQLESGADTIELSNLKSQDVSDIMDQIALENIQVKIDTVNSIEEIVTKGSYYINNPPDKGSPWQSYLAYVLGIIGLAFGSFQYFNKSKNKKE